MLFFIIPNLLNHSISLKPYFKDFTGVYLTYTPSHRMLIYLSIYNYSTVYASWHICHNIYLKYDVFIVYVYACTYVCSYLLIFCIIYTYILPLSQGRALEHSYLYTTHQCVLLYAFYPQQFIYFVIILK